jgi:glycine cleavage system regulatory protein
MSLSLVLTVIGDDRPGLVERLSAAIGKHGGNWLQSSMSHLSGKFAGIVREVSSVLARHALNVEELATHTASAPMSAEVLFHATTELTASPSLDTRALVRDLERISSELMADITLDESIRRSSSSA